MPFVSYLHRVADRQHLTAAEACDAMLAILSGHATTPQIAAFLVALRMKGEQADELLGFARAMREKATPVVVSDDGPPLLDTCGTGGDGGRTFNVSTVAAFVAAGAGLRVAKHGNRSLSSQCGSADVLEALGVDIAMPADTAARAISEIGIGFLFAPLIHPAMKHAQPARAELKMRTVFNLLGPLCNPAGASIQVIGAPSLEAARLMAGALSQLPIRRAFVVHGADGMDEITTLADTVVLSVRPGSVEESIVCPEMFGVSRASAADLVGGDRHANAEIARAILSGEKGPKRDIVLMNAGAALVAAGVAASWGEGYERAAEAVDSGRASEKLKRLVAYAKEGDGRATTAYTSK